MTNLIVYYYNSRREHELSHQKYYNILYTEYY